MSQPAIKVEGLCKEYVIGAHSKDENFREMLVNNLAAPFRQLMRGQFKAEQEEQFLALQDVSFEIQPGEVVGIIGSNGAGKSTLLKILSRITEPTRGRVEIRGRVSSLLEVGTGFHPELTGKENVFLNGAILGMSRRDISRKFDEIVSFAELEKFIDTPVKHYSSGMYVRLAFAVAAHLEPDILIVDEVLAVGDAAFQRKSLGKMEAVGKQGRTVLVVSHSMPTVSRLCQRAILFEKGLIVQDAPVSDIVDRYLSSDNVCLPEKHWALTEAPGDAVARIYSVRAVSEELPQANLDIRRPVQIEMEYECLQENAALFASFAFFDVQGTFLFATVDFQEPSFGKKLRRKGKYWARCSIPGNFFAEGQIKVAAEVSTREPSYKIHALALDCISFEVTDTGQPGSVRDGWGHKLPGALRPMLPWQSEYRG